MLICFHTIPPIFFDQIEITIEMISRNRVEDLRELEEITGVENFIEGKICIARYGKIFRGNKVHNCQNKGAIGIYF